MRLKTRAGGGVSEPEAPPIAVTIRESEGQPGAQDSAVAHDLVPRPGSTPVLTAADSRKLRRALGAPGLFPWRDLLSTDLLNPGNKSLDPDTLAAVDAAVAMYRETLQSLTEEAKRTTREELAELEAAGQAVQIQPGESAFGKVGDDAVYTLSLASGGGIAASKRDMPRLQEVEARLQRTGADVIRSITRVLLRDGILDDGGVRSVELVLADWKSGSWPGR